MTTQTQTTSLRIERLDETDTERADREFYSALGASVLLALKATIAAAK
jgi:hypothetical protein